jgi:hypothetical protein
MRESNAYQEILDEGRVEGELRHARRILIRQGVRRLGVASPTVEARLESITSLDVLDALIDRVSDVETWDDLLSTAS